MTRNELIHRYLLGISTSEEVQELEQQLRKDPSLQDEFLLQAEIDTHLRQEDQSIVSISNTTTTSSYESKSSSKWRWVAGLSTLAASILAVVVLFSLPTQRSVFAQSFLGDLVLDIPWNQTNLWSYAGRGDVRGVRDEMSRGKSVNARLNNGLTPLHLATLYNKTNVVEVLLDAGADPSLADSKGNTPLHMAAFLARVDIVAVLLERGASSKERNGLGFSAIDLASFEWDRDLVAYYTRVEQAMNTRLDLRRIQASRAKVVELLSQSGREDTPTSELASLWEASIRGDLAAIRVYGGLEHRSTKKRASVEVLP